MERNFNTGKSVPFRPIRRCRKKTGLPSSSQIHAAKNNHNGSNNRRPIPDNRKSNGRLKIGSWMPELKFSTKHLCFLMACSSSCRLRHPTASDQRSGDFTWLAALIDRWHESLFAALKPPIASPTFHASGTLLVHAQGSFKASQLNGPLAAPGSLQLRIRLPSKAAIPGYFPLQAFRQTHPYLEAKRPLKLAGSIDVIG